MNQPFRKASSLVLALALTASLSLPALAFTDTAGHWAQQSIQTLSQRGIINGYPNGQFRPEGQVTRAEFATMLVKASGLDSQPSSNTSHFVDVPAGFWAAHAIDLVSSNGLVSGYPGGFFRPNQNISRAEAMSVLVRAAHLPMPSPDESAQILRNYGDAAQVPQWAIPAVAAAIKSGIFINYPSANLIEPNQPATRAQIAVMTDHFQNIAQNGPASVPVTGNNPGNNAGSNSVYNTNEGYSSSSTTMNPQTNMIRGRVSVVPANSTFTAVVTQPFSSDRSQVGDPVNLTLDRPILSASGDIVVPQGSQVQGSIIRINPANRVERNGSVGIDFNRIVTPDGRTFNISAEVNADNGLLVGGTTKGRIGNAALRTAGGAAIGGAAGAVIGRIAKKGRADEGLLWGSLIGGGLGAASSVAAKGKETVVQPGETLQLRLRQPLSVSNP